MHFSYPFFPTCLSRKKYYFNMKEEIVTELPDTKGSVETVSLLTGW